MTDFFSSFLPVFGLIFSFSFLVALTGAIVPGPLLTYTIFKSTETRQRGYLMGVYITIGHALIEVGIVVCLLLGFSFILQNKVVVRSIGIIGGIVLLYLGYSIIRDVRLGKIRLQFADESPHSTDPSPRTRVKEANSLGHWLMENPVTGGMIISMSNPYWWVWWATIGFAFMVQFEVSLKQWSKLLAFFLGHEAGDMTWYVIVSFLSFFGIRRLNKKSYQIILVLCGIFMMFFGTYMAVMPFFK